MVLRGTQTQLVNGQGVLFCDNLACEGLRRINVSDARLLPNRQHSPAPHRKCCGSHTYTLALTWISNDQSWGCTGWQGWFSPAARFWARFTYHPI